METTFLSSLRPASPMPRFRALVVGACGGGGEAPLAALPRIRLPVAARARQQGAGCSRQHAVDMRMLIHLSSVDRVELGLPRLKWVRANPGCSSQRSPNLFCFWAIFATLVYSIQAGPSTHGARRNRHIPAIVMLWLTCARRARSPERLLVFTRNSVFAFVLLTLLLPFLPGARRREQACFTRPMFWRLVIAGYCLMLSAAAACWAKARRASYLLSRGSSDRGADHR